MNIELNSESVYYDFFCQIPFLKDPAYNVSSSAFVPFCKPLFAIVKNVVALGDFDEVKIRLFSDLKSTHLKSSEAIPEESRLLSWRNEGSLEIALCFQ